MPSSNRNLSSAKSTVQAAPPIVFLDGTVALLGEHGCLLQIALYLKPNIVDLFSLTMSCKAAFTAIAPAYTLWRESYLANEPLTPKELKKRLSKDSYCDHKQLLGRRNGLQYSVWLRTCLLLYRKPRLILVLQGRDPILVRPCTLACNVPSVQYPLGY
jgi:hypothetical protein